MYYDFESFAAKAYHKTDCPDKNFIAPGLTHYLKGRWWFRRWNQNGKYMPTSQEKETDTVPDVSK